MKKLKGSFQTLMFGMVFLFMCGDFTAAQQLKEKSKLRVDQIQLLGTHNSYHLAPDEVAMAMIKGVAPKEALALEVSMPTLDEQLEKFGVRHFELDLCFSCLNSSLIHFRRLQSPSPGMLDPWINWRPKLCP